MCSTPPPSGNRSQKQPPAFASTERLRASREKVCIGSHQPPTPSVSAVYTVAGGALIAAVFRTRKPAAVLSITSPRRGAVRIAKRIARGTIFDRIIWFALFLGLVSLGRIADDQTNESTRRDDLQV